MQIARSSCHAWLAAADSRAVRTADDEALAERIRVVHAEDTAYGAPRITAELNDAALPGERVKHKRVSWVMRGARIVGYRRKRRVTTTVSDPADRKVPDLLNRDFTPEKPNVAYVGDITYLPVFVVSQDPFQTGGSQTRLGGSVWDEFRGWDGMEDLSKALRAVSATDRPRWRESAAQRFWTASHTSYCGSTNPAGQTTPTRTDGSGRPVQTVYTKVVTTRRKMP